MRRCRRTWKRTRAALLRASSRSQLQANRRHLPAPQYAPGQRVWLRAKDLPLKGISQKISPRFIGPFEIETIINPRAVRLRLPPSLRIHPTFHVSQVNPVSTSPLSPPAPPPPPRRVVVDDPGWRWGRSGGRQQAGGDRLDLGDVEVRMYTERWGKSETNGTGVNNSLDLKGADETGGEFGRNSLQVKVLYAKPHLLSGSVLGGR